MTTRREPRIWGVLCMETGGEPMYADHVIARGEIAVGATEAGPVTDFETREAFIAAFEQAAGRSSRRPGQVWRLQHEAQHDDWLVLPDGGRGVLHLGRLVGGSYHFVPEGEDGDCRFGHRWNVEWLGTISRTRAKELTGVDIAFRQTVQRLHMIDLADLETLLAAAEPIDAPTSRPSDAEAPPSDGVDTGEGAAPDLRVRDEADIEAVRQGGTYRMRRTHDHMTNVLRRSYVGKEKRVSEGRDPDALYDAMVHDHDGEGRDLLIEVKSSADRGTVRLAIGQLLDYRRVLAHATDARRIDLAVLLPGQPEPRVKALLEHVGVRLPSIVDGKISPLS